MWQYTTLGKMYAIDLNGNRVWPFLPPTPTGAGSDEIAVAPDGSRAFVANVLDNTVSALQLADPRNSFNSFPIMSPNGIDVSPEGKK